MSIGMIIPFVILQVAAVVAIVLFLRMLLHKQLEMGLSRIKKMDRDNLEKEAKLNERVEKLNKEYDTKIDDAEHQADILINMAKEGGKKIRDEERAKAKDEAKKIIASALQEKEKMLEESKGAVYRKALDFSVMILKKALSKEAMAQVKSVSHKEALDALLSNNDVVECIKKEKRSTIVTSENLTSSMKEYIEKAVNEKAGQGIAIDFSVDENIIGGLVFKVGTSTIDASLMHRLALAAAEVREEI